MEQGGVRAGSGWGEGVSVSSLQQTLGMEVGMKTHGFGMVIDGRAVGREGNGRGVGMEAWEGGQWASRPASEAMLAQVDWCQRGRGDGNGWMITSA